MTTFKRMEIEDVILVVPKIYEDNRGFFMETYKESVFELNGIKDYFNQDNHSSSTKGVLRGLHYQKPPFMQAKLVRCLSGKILDIAVDVRKNSKTFGHWCSAVLSSENKNMLYIPKGFAHGFVALDSINEVAYKASGEYNQASEMGVLWNDPGIKISWQIDFEPILSEKDKLYNCLKDIKEEDLA